MTEARKHTLATLALAAAGCCWGTGFYFGKVALSEMSVLENVSWRFIFGTLGFLPLLLRFVRLTRRDWALLISAAIIGVPVQFLVQFKGLQLTSVSHASLMIGSLPVMLAIASAYALHERLHTAGWMALTASTIGAVLIATAHSNTSGASGAGDALVGLSMLAAVVMTLTTKSLIGRYDPLYVSAMMIAVGTVPLVISDFAIHRALPHYSVHAWIALAAQGLIATTAAYSLWNWGLARRPVSNSGAFLNLEPVIGTILGTTLLGDRLGAGDIVGGVLIIAGALYFTL